VRAILICLLAASLALPTTGRTEEPRAQETPKRPRVVLVLSGGGARGSAHVGVIKVLEEYHVPVDMVVGTSMGSIVGGLYAVGWSPQEIEQKITTIDWATMFVDRLPRKDKTFRRKEEETRFLIPVKMRFKNWKPYLPPAVVGGQNLEILFQSLEIEATGERDFDRFPIPYRAVAADFSNGRAFVIGKGSLSAAMRASMSLPGIFPPVEIDGTPLTDGGVAANFPIRIARGLGADVIIGVDITSPLRKKEELGSLLTRIDQVSGLLTNGNKEADMVAVRPADVILVPDLGDITFSDFARAQETIDRGEAAARAQESRLRALAVSDDEWRAYKAKLVRRPVSDLKLDAVRLVNTGPLDDKIVAARVNLKVGETLDENAVARDIRQLYGMDVFGTIHHDFRRDDGQGVLTIETPKKPYGRNSLQFGFFLASDFRESPNFNLTASHLFNPINRMGGEWRNIVQVGNSDLLATEYYQPLDVHLAWVFLAAASYRRDNVNIYDDAGNALAAYRFASSDARVGFGRLFGRWGELTSGAYFGRSRGNLTIGSPLFPAAATDLGGPYARFRVDTLNSVTWPRSGTWLDVLYRRALESFGADSTGGYALLSAGETVSFGKNTLHVSADVSDLVSGTPSYQTVFFAGGFLRLSGLANNQLVGTRGGVARFLYYRELAKFDLGSLTNRMYAGFSLEAGNTYQPGDAVTWPSLRRAGSIFLGADTFLGPAYFGYGYCEGGFDAVYLVIGQRF